MMRTFTTPRDADLALKHIANGAGLSADFLPNGAIFALNHESEGRRIMVNQVLGSPVGGGIGRVCLRIAGGKALDLTGAAARFGAGGDCAVWEGEGGGIDYRVTLWLAPGQSLWLWRVEIANRRRGAVDCEVVLVQDLGLGERGFIRNNEAYVSQYIDHHIARDPNIGPVIMSRQNLAQRGAYPWAMHGCLDGGGSFATDGLQVFGPGYRETGVMSLDLPGAKLQHELALAAVSSRTMSLKPGAQGGKGGKGGKVKSRKQAIAIGLSEARKKGAKVPKKAKKKKKS